MTYKLELTLVAALVIATPDVKGKIGISAKMAHKHVNSQGVLVELRPNTVLQLSYQGFERGAPGAVVMGFRPSSNSVPGNHISGIGIYVNGTDSTHQVAANTHHRRNRSQGV